MADSIIDKLKQQFRQGSVLLKLIYINVAIFLLLRLTWVVLMLFNIDGYVILPFIEMPSIPYEFITHPWTLLTYMFVHYDVWHILFNMLWLYWFGQIFLMSFSEKQMVGLYLLGGIAGGLLYLLSYNLFPYFDGKEGLMCGASASISGALNGLILPITLGVCLIASQKKSVMGEDYHHPVLLLVLGIVVVVVSGYLGITSLSSLSALFA